MLRLSAKKRILISGFLIIFLLEVAFGVYVAFERRHESSLMAQKLAVEEALPAVDVDLVSPAFSNGLLRADQIRKTDGTAAIDSPRDPAGPTRGTVAVRGVKKRTVGDLTAIRSRVKTPVKVDTALADNPKVAKPNEFSSQPVIANETSSKGDAEKRSFLAKAMPIVRKPFGWLRALGSKLK